MCIIYHIRICFIFLPANGTLTKYFLDFLDSVLFTEALKSNFVGKLTLQASTKHQASSIKFCRFLQPNGMKI